MPKNLLRNFVLLCLVVVAIVFSYLLGSLRQHATTERNDLLLEIDYSGGWMDPEDEKNALGAIQLYRDGRISKETRSGQITTTFGSDSRVQELSTIIDSTNFEDTFVERKRKICPSAVDGIDNVYIFYLSDGQVKEFSNCDYDLQRTPLLEQINDILSSEVE